MARPKKNQEKTETKKYTRRGLQQRIQGWSDDKIMKLKAQAESTIRYIAAEGLRRQELYLKMQDTSVLTESAADSAKALEVDDTASVVTSVVTPYAPTSTTPANGNARVTTTSP